MTRRIVLLAAVGLMACGPKKPTYKAPTRTAVLAALQLPMETGQPQDAPPILVSGLHDTLRSAGLDPRVLTVATIPEGLQQKTIPAFRANWLAEQSGDQPVVLVETSAVYISNLQGRYRWEVTMTATAVDPARVEEAVSREVRYPVFLRFPHEDEVDAVEEATPMIQRGVARLLQEAGL